MSFVHSYTGSRTYTAQPAHPTCYKIRKPKRSATPKNGHIIYQKHGQHEHINFCALRYYQFGWETQTNVNEKRNELREACLFYYDFDVAAVQRYCSGRYTSHQRRPSECFEVIKNILKPDTFWNFIAGEIDGVPNCLDGETTYQQFQNQKKEANRKSIIGHEKLVHNFFVKEDAHNMAYSLTPISPISFPILESFPSVLSCQTIKEQDYTAMEHLKTRR
jgi:hypothetical protein